MANYSVCGIDCEKCEVGHSNQCPGCKEMKGKVFWGECDLYKCNSQKTLYYKLKFSHYLSSFFHLFKFDKRSGLCPFSINAVNSAQGSLEHSPQCSNPFSEAHWKISHSPQKISPFCLTQPPQLNCSLNWQVLQSVPHLPLIMFRFLRFSILSVFSDAAHSFNISQGN